jgi:cell filamentation protein
LPRIYAFDKIGDMNKVKLFEEKIVRSTWDEKAEKWWFSIIDAVAILIDQSDYEKSRNYWKWLKGKQRRRESVG